MGASSPTQQRKMKAGFSQAPKVHIKKFFSQARKQVNAAKGLKKKTGSRLYVKGVVASFKRSQAKQHNHTNLIKIQGVETTKDAEFYYGKKIMYVYRAHNTKDVKDEKGESSSTRFRVMWGKVCRSHGTSGTVRAKFTKNLPPSALGAPVRIMLFPSRV